MDLEQLLNILADRERCDFCPNAAHDCCTHCKQIDPITAADLREFYRLVGVALVDNDRRKKSKTV